MLIRILKNCIIFASIPAILGIAAFLMLPTVLKATIPQLIEQSTGRKSALKKVTFNPVSMQLSAHGFSLAELNGKPFAAFDLFYIDVNTWRSIKESAVVIDKVLLDKPDIRIAKHKDGQFNFNDLVKSKEDTKEKGNKIFPLIIEDISLTKGKLTWEDAQSNPSVTEQIYPIDFEVKNFTIHDGKQFPVDIALSLKSGGKLDWQGVASVNPIASSGHIKLENLNLKKILELAANSANFDLQGNGMLDLEYQFNYGKQQTIDLFIKRSLIKVQKAQLTQNSPDTINVVIGEGSAEGEYRLAYRDKALELDVANSRIKLQKFQFSGKDNLTVKLGDSDLEGQYKLNYKDNVFQIKNDKSKLNINSLQLPELANSKTLLDIPVTSLEAAYQLDNRENRIHFSLSGNTFDLKNLSLSELGQREPLIKIPTFNVKGISFDLAKQSVSIDDVKTANANFRAWLNADGKINYLLLLPVTDSKDRHASRTVAVDKPPTRGVPAWNISVKQFQLMDYAFSFQDRSLQKTVSFNAKPVNLKLSNFSNKAGNRMPVEFNAGIDENGSIKLTGDTVVDPFSTRLTVKIDDIDLEKLQPYIDKYKAARLDIIDGRWNATGKLALSLPANDKPDIKFNGNTGIEDLLTRDQILNKDFIKWRNLTFHDIDADVKTNRYTAKKLVIEKPFARVVIAKNKTVNVNDVFMADKTNKPAGTSKAIKTGNSNKDRPYFKLDKVQVIDGSSDFADLSLILPFAAQIKSLNGGASGISSEQKSTVQVGLKGNAYDLAPVDIKGDISPYLGNFNVELNFQGMPMPLVSPYMVQFAGYKVEKGKLTLGLKYKVENKQLTASNSILIDQFELGEKVENPNAVSIPLELAIALLKDSDGKIKMDVPITGSLEDPKLSVGKIIGDAFLNSIKKIISSPFKALASLIGSEENLSTVSFAPGKSDLDKKQLKKLDDLIKLLKDRPVLSFEIKGAAFQQEDWPALREAALYDQLKHQKAAEVSKKGGKKILAEYVELSDEDYKRLLADKFIEKFPLLADKSLFGTPRLTNGESGDFYDVAKQKLSEVIKPEENRLKHLAEERAQAIAKYIVQKGGISNDRIYILDTAIDPERENKDIVTRLSLKTN